MSVLRFLCVVCLLVFSPASFAADLPGIPNLPTPGSVPGAASLPNPAAGGLPGAGGFPSIPQFPNVPQLPNGFPNLPGAGSTGLPEEAANINLDAISPKISDDEDTPKDFFDNIQKKATTGYIVPALYYNYVYGLTGTLSVLGPDELDFHSFFFQAGFSNAKNAVVRAGLFEFEQNYGFALSLGGFYANSVDDQTIGIIQDEFYFGPELSISFFLALMRFGYYTSTAENQNSGVLLISVGMGIL